MLLDPQLLELFRSVIGPALGAVVVLALFWRPWRRAKTTGDGIAPNPWIVGVTLGVAFMASWLLAQGFHGFWPTDTSRRIIWAPVLGLLVAGAAALAGGTKRWPVMGLVVLAGSLTLTWFLTAHRRQPGRWEGGEIALWTGAWTLALGVGWLGLVYACTKRHGMWLPLVLSFVATALALVVTRAGVASLGQMGGALSAWLGFAFLLAIWNRSFSLRGAGAHVLGASLASIILLGYTTSPEPRPLIGLGLATLLPLVVAPAGLLLKRQEDGSFAWSWRAALIDLALLGVLAGLAIWFAKPPTINSDEPSLDDLYGLTTETPVNIA